MCNIFLTSLHFIKHKVEPLRFFKILIKLQDVIMSLAQMEYLNFFENFAPRSSIILFNDLNKSKEKSTLKNCLFKHFDRRVLSKFPTKFIKKQAKYELITFTAYSLLEWLFL